MNDAVVSNLVIAGNLPVNLVQQGWFAAFMQVVDPMYRLPSRHKVNAAISQKFVRKCAVLQSKLLDAKYVTLTLDMWSDRRLRSITVHFVSASMQFQSYLLDFSYFSGRHTGDKLSFHCGQVIEKYHLSNKESHISDH